MIRDKKLEDQLFQYIKEHENDNTDLVDLHTTFSNYRMEQLLDSIIHLRTTKQIFRVPIGIYYYYTTINPNNDDNK